MSDLICPRCKGTSFTEVDCGPDSYDDDIFYISEICDGCGLWRSGWTNKWMIDVTSWRDEEDAKEFMQQEEKLTTHPMQPIEMDDGVARFKQNKIVRYLLDLATESKLADMNKLAIIPFSVEDRVQFAQLIGYSVSGFGDLDYVPRDVVAQADTEAAKLINRK